jgi:hypothetical protein
MTNYTVKIGDTEFANVSYQGIGALDAGVMTFVNGTVALAVSEVVTFNFPKLTNGPEMKGAIAVVNTATAIDTGTLSPFTKCVVTAGTYVDTVAVTMGTTIAIGDKLVVMALYGV